MRALLIYLLVVVLLPPARAGLSVAAGHVYEVNLEILRQLEENVTWVGIHGSVGTDPVPRRWEYFSTAFGTFTVSPPPNVRRVEVVTERTLAIPVDLGNWYAAIFASSDLNVYGLEGTCDVNVDGLIRGNFCEECAPSRTFAGEENIRVNGREVCARVARVTEEGRPVYLLSYSSRPVYLAPVRSSRYFFLASTLDSNGGTFYMYLLRNRPACGDLVCDPGDLSECPGDCVRISVESNTHYAEVGVGGSVSFALTVRNETNTYGVSVALSVSLPREWNYALSPRTVHVAEQGSSTVLLTVTPGTEGNRTVRVSALVGEHEMDSVEIWVYAGAGGEEGEGAPGEGGGAPPAEENVVAVPIAGGGYWIPSLGCISNIQVVGPDRINALLEENVVANVFIQNAGTCDENVRVTVEGVPGEWVALPWRWRALAGGEGAVLPLRVFAGAPGIYTVRVTAMGYTGGYHEFELLVARERVRGAAGCTHSVTVAVPEEITVVEGEEVNDILISNAGTCRERVEIVVKKTVADLEVVLDRKEFYLSPGERYAYTLPKLAPGDYVLSISAGNVSRESRIRVLPPPVLGEVGEAFVRFRWLLVLIMFLVLVGAVGYVRHRYLR